MRSFWVAGILIVLGVIVAVASWTFAPVCEVGGLYLQTTAGKQFPMACGYTARAEIGIGSMIVFSGAALMLVKNEVQKRVFGAFAGALGVLAIAFPTYLTGMCANPAHSCRTEAEPVLILTGLAVVAVGVGLVLMKPKRT